MGSYDGRTAVITGGSSGFGLATARLLAEGGARVMITGRTQATLDRAAGELGPNAVAVRSDTASLADIDALAGRVQACGTSTSGYVSDWISTGDAISTRTSSECGREYRLKSVVLIEVTFCAYPPSVPGIVMTNILDRIPG